MCWRKFYARSPTHLPEVCKKQTVDLRRFSEVSVPCHVAVGCFVWNFSKIVKCHEMPSSRYLFSSLFIIIAVIAVIATIAIPTAPARYKHVDFCGVENSPVAAEPSDGLFGMTEGDARRCWFFNPTIKHPPGWMCLWFLCIPQMYSFGIVLDVLDDILFWNGEFEKWMVKSAKRHWVLPLSARENLIPQNKKAMVPGDEVQRTDNLCVVWAESLGDFTNSGGIASGKHTKSYWKWP